jgi:predicted transposase/invertase (TIGR01784 family)
MEFSAEGDPQGLHRLSAKAFFTPAPYIGRRQIMSNTFISPLDDDVFKRLYGDRKNIAHTVELLKPVLGIPPEDFDRLTIVVPSLRRRWRRRREKYKLGILDLQIATKTERMVDVEVQVRRYKLMLPRLVFYHSMMTADQMKAGYTYDKIRPTITVVIANYTLLPEEEDYMNTYELRNRKTGRLFTDLQKYIILELPKLPENDDGQPMWPQLRFLKSRAKEDMELLVEKHPEMRAVVADYKRMTLIERFRKRAEAREKDRRDTWAALEYAKDEVRAELGKVIEEKDQTIEEKDQELEAKDRENEELRRKLREAGIDN